MKKQLFKTAFAAVCLIGGMVLSPFEAKAQTLTDVTSTYLTNADLSFGSGTGWTKTGNWTDNSGNANGTVYVSENYSGWDSQNQTDFALTQTVTLPEGLYKIEAYGFYSGTVGKAVLSAKSSTTTLGSTYVAVRGDISSSGNNDLQKAANSFNSNYNYLNTVYFYLTTNTSVTIGFSGAHTDKRQWFVAGPMKLYKYSDDSTISSSAALDFTSMIYNPNFESGNTDGWTTTASSDTGAKSTTEDNYKMSNSDGKYLFNTWWKGTPCTQTLAYLPAGQYELSSVVASDGATIYLINGDNTNDYAYTETTDKTVGITLKKNFLLTSDASNYKIGVVGSADGTAGEHKNYQADGHWWYKCDYFTLTYKGNGVEHYATTQSGDAAADTWYAQDITLAGSYTLTTNGSSTIVYTQNPALEPARVTTTASNGDELTLAVGTIYYKASTATPLTIVPASYSYDIGTATLSMSDGSYIQSQTFTVTFPNALTNDNNASVALVANSTATVNGNSVILTSVTNGFSLNLGTLTPATNYTISIPAGIYGYSGHDMNTAISLTVHTPAIFDQTAFLKDNGTGLFLARGYDWGTRAYLDIYGTATQITTDAEGYTTFKFVDTDRYLFYDSSNNLYCDRWAGGNETKWIVTLAGGKYRLTGKDKTAGTNYVKYDDGDTYHLLWADGTGKSDENIVDWNLVSASDYADAMVTLKNTQASTAATATGLTATTPTALATAVNSWANGKVIAGTAVTKTAEKFKQGQTNPAPITIVSGEVSITTPGLYKFTMQAFYRMRDNATNYTLHTQGWDQPAAYVYFGDAKTQVASVFDASNTSSDGCYTGADGKYYPNGQNAAKTAFQAGNYINTVWKYVTQAEIDAANGKFEYGLKYQGWPNWGEWENGSQKIKVDQWSCWAIESVELTLYAENNADYVKDGVRHYIGTYASAPEIELTDDVPVANTTAATFSSGTSTVNFTNPNGLIFANSGQINSDKNVVAGTTCANLQLEKGHPFINPKEFTATSAKYTMVSGELAGGNFATLMVPFTASLPSGGSAYKLDQELDLMDGTVRGTSTSIAANSPVLVTAAGNYTGSNVTVPVVASGATFESGELVGTYSPMTAVKGSYVLQNHTSGEGVAFYLVGNTKPTVNPFRAYIKPQSSNARAIKVVFGDETEGIDSLTPNPIPADAPTHSLSPKGEGSVYTLSGQRVAQPTKGLYIVNGKKMIK